MLSILKGAKHVPEKLGPKGACRLSDMLNRAQPYINYKEKNSSKDKNQEPWNPEYYQVQKKTVVVIENVGWGPRARFSAYASL